MSDDTIQQRLTDESDLRDLIHRYAFGLDRQDWTLWRSVFADEITMEMPGDRPDREPRAVAAERVVQNATVLFAGLGASQHFIGSHRYEIDGDRAVITAHMRAEHWLTPDGADDSTPDELYTMFGTYIDDCVRTSAGWKINHVRLRLIRDRGDKRLLRTALERGRALHNA